MRRTPIHGQRLLGVAAAVVLGSAFFSCLLMTIAGIVLLGTPSHLGIGFAVLVVAGVLGIVAASSLLGRLAR